MTVRWKLPLLHQSVISTEATRNGEIYIYNISHPSQKILIPKVRDRMTIRGGLLFLNVLSDVTIQQLKD
jgi:hypothetical protein